MISKRSKRDAKRGNQKHNNKNVPREKRNKVKMVQRRCKMVEMKEWADSSLILHQGERNQRRSFQSQPALNTYKPGTSFN